MSLSSRLIGNHDIEAQRLRKNVENILNGHSSFHDFNQLFIGLRGKTRGMKVFREIGDFVAHRDQRNQGYTFKHLETVKASAIFWLKGLQDVHRTEFEATAAALANIDLSTDEEIASLCAVNKKTAIKSIKRTSKLLSRGLIPNQRDEFIFTTFASKFIWKPAFTSKKLFVEFISVLQSNNLIDNEAENVCAKNIKHRLSLFVLELLHGVELQMTDKSSIYLNAGYTNKDKLLEIKALFNFGEFNKPVSMPICIFLTSMKANDYCDPELLSNNPYSWTSPIKLDDSWKLKFL